MQIQGISFCFCIFVLIIGLQIIEFAECKTNGDYRRDRVSNTKKHNSNNNKGQKINDKRKSTPTFIVSVVMLYVCHTV